MIAIDFETTYDKKEGLSVASQGGYAYVTDRRFRAYLVAIVGEGIRYCGPVENFDWHQIHGKEVCAHNARFDQLVFELGCKTLGQIPVDVVPTAWHCTADLAAWLGCARSLAQAAGILLGKKKDKTIRKQMDGLTLDAAREQGMEQALLEYCLDDAECCLELWDKYHDQWPEEEQLLSWVNRAEGERGLRVNTDELNNGIMQLRKQLFIEEQRIPWDWSANKTPCSPKLLATQCRLEGIPAPSSTDKDDPDYLKWDAEYGDKHPWIRAMQAWRSCNTLLTKLKSIQSRVRPDGTIAVELLYFGAHTGRFSGTGGVNFHNLHQQSLHDVDLRGMFIPRPGMKFFIADLSQIEPRVLAVLTENWEFLELCEHGGPYEAHARLSMGWTGGTLKEENLEMYALAKARVLSLGYGAGWRKFLEMAKGYITDPAALARIFSRRVTKQDRVEFLEYLETCDGMMGKPGASHKELETISPDELTTFINSWKQVREFRESNPLIIKLWRRLENDLKLSAGSPSRLYEVVLPSGRVKNYWHVAALKKVTAVTVRGEPPTHLYGGKLTENLVQAVARDVFVHGYLNLHKAGFHVPLHVHDENLVEAPEDTDPELIVRAMCQRPDWFQSCPIDAEIKIMDQYSK